MQNTTTPSPMPTTPTMVTTQSGELPYHYNPAPPTSAPSAHARRVAQEIQQSHTLKTGKARA